MKKKTNKTKAKPVNNNTSKALPELAQAKKLIKNTISQLEGDLKVFAQRIVSDIQRLETAAKEKLNPCAMKQYEVTVDVSPKSWLRDDIPAIFSFIVKAESEKEIKNNIVEHYKKNVKKIVQKADFVDYGEVKFLGVEKYARGLDQISKINRKKSIKIESIKELSH